MKNSQAWVISLIRTDNLANNKCNKVVLNLLSGRFSNLRVKEFIGTIYHICCRDLIEQEMEYKYKKPAIQFHNHNLSYFISISYASFAIIAQKSEILKIGPNFLKWKGLDDKEWDYKKMEGTPKSYEAQEAMRANLTPWDICTTSSS